MKNETDILMMNKIKKKDLKYTSVDNKTSNRITFLTITLPKTVDDIQNKSFDEKINDSDKLEGEGIEKLIKRSKLIDIYNRLEVLIGSKTIWSYQYSDRSW